MVHKKPTQEELAKNLEKIQEEIDAPEDPKPSEPAPSEPVPSEPAPSEPVPSEPAPSEEPTPSEPPPSPDYKKKFSASARENQKILAKNRKLNQAIDEANAIPEPTDEEMQGMYRDWDVMTEVEKGFAKEMEVGKRWRAKLSQAREEAKKIEKWEEEVVKFTDDPKTLVEHPELEGKTEEFRVFATKEAHNSVPFNLLISAFLHEEQKQNKPKKGSMFPQGSGGPNDKGKPKTDKLSVEEAGKLMKTDYNKYKQLLIAGKISMSID